MDKHQLKSLLDAELRVWAAKPFDHLLQELSEVVAYERGEGSDVHQFEVQILEQEDTALHVCIAIDDCTMFRSIRPLTSGFSAHRDGRTELKEVRVP